MSIKVGSINKKATGIIIDIILKMYKSISDSYVNVGKSLYTLFY